MRGIRRPVGLSGAVLGLALLAPLTLGAVSKGGPGARPGPTCPSFVASSFHRSTSTDNPYWPLVPGTRFTYQGTAQKTSLVDVVTVTHNAPRIDGVRTVEVRDQGYEGGVLTEDTRDWYAQDDEGNVW